MKKSDHIKKVVPAKKKASTKSVKSVSKTEKKSVQAPAKASTKKAACNKNAKCKCNGDCKCKDGNHKHCKCGDDCMCEKLAPSSMPDSARFEKLLSEIFADLNSSDLIKDYFFTELVKRGFDAQTAAAMTNKITVDVPIEGVISIIE